MRFLGIDTDTKGSIALFDHGANTLTVYKMPAHTVEISDSDKLRVDRSALAKLLLRLFAAARPDVIVLERQWARPATDQFGNKVQGIASTFTFGETYGTILGAVYATVAHCQVTDSAYAPRIELVEGKKWKAGYNLPADKKAAVALATRFFPQCEQYWKKAMDVSAAEASLIALYGALVCARVPINVNKTEPLDFQLLGFAPITGQRLVKATKKPK